MDEPAEHVSRPKKSTWSFRRLFNQHMIAGAILWAVIWHGYSTISEALHHVGPGSISYSLVRPDFRTGDDGEWEAKTVDEATYKRHQLAWGTVDLGMGLFLWVLISGVWRPMPGR